MHTCIREDAPGHSDNPTTTKSFKRKRPLNVYFLQPCIHTLVSWKGILPVLPSNVVSSVIRSACSALLLPLLLRCSARRVKKESFPPDQNSTVRSPAPSSLNVFHPAPTVSLAFLCFLYWTSMTVCDHDHVMKKARARSIEAYVANRWLLEPRLLSVDRDAHACGTRPGICTFFNYVQQAGKSPLGRVVDGYPSH